MKKKYILSGFMLLVSALALAACGSASPTDTPTPCPVVEPCPDCPQVSCPDCPACPELDAVLVPFQTEWAGSPHNDIDAEAFRHWDEDDPAQVPQSCAKCHSTPGYLDYMGADGSQFGVVEDPAPIGTTIECVACHNEVTLQHDSVVFPSGLILTDLGDQARCMECHQGRSSKFSVDESISAAVGEDLDIVSEDLGFINIHYYAAAATRYGSEVKGGYEYDGLAYDPRFDHVDGYQTCISCHDMHTLKLNVAECSLCHQGVSTQDDLKNIRFAGSLNDYDGDGDAEEPIKDEISGLQEMLYGSMQEYAIQVAGSPLVYDADTYPYFFDDVGQSYAAWTGRLLQAAYNYQVSLKDPGAFAHGGKYIIQLLYDSIADLNTQLSEPVAMNTLHREDPGHFAASGEAWRHWDADEPQEVPASCSKCHSAEGLPTFITTGGETYPQPVASGLNCASCHDDLTTFTRYVSQEVTFPSGATVAFENVEANLCLNCHQGRESKTSVDAAIASAGVADDDVSDSLSFRNPHYFAAGATLFGTEAQGAYEYDGKIYNGRFLHVQGYQTCIECHDSHALSIKVNACGTCHGTMSEDELQDIRISTGDYDGDDDTSTGIAFEVKNFNNAILEAIYLYASEVIGTPIVFNAQIYPYWFLDKDSDGLADPEETNYSNRYNLWTPRLLRATYNYTWALKDPGSYAHNGLYIIQVLYDTLQDIGGDISGLTRPEVTQ